ncbi:MAG: type II toxin-antitoxin system VapC family toxin [Candidatus Bathyarchaeia archaeon]
MTIIDTTVMIALLKGKPDTVKKINELLDKNDTIAITVITVYELLKGAYLSSRRQENLLDVKKAISNIQILDLSPEACAEAAGIYCELKNAGKLISEFDILIAAIAKTNGEPILTHDQHFKAIQGLRLI